MKLNRLERIFLAEEPSKVLGLFRKAIYLTMAYLMVAMTLPNAVKFWGKESIMKNWEWGNTFMLKFQYLMMEHWLDNLWWLLVVIHLLALIFAFLGRYQRIAHAIVFITTVWLYHRMFLYVIGGNLLLIALLFYLIFADEKKKDFFNFQINRWILLACQVQICMVYFFSGLWKLAGEEWVNGSAMYYILSVEEYSHPWVMENIASKKWITILATYSALCYQLLFPFLVWFKKMKRPLLLLGIMFHLFIGIAMGIWDFALIMIASYTAFWDFDKFSPKNLAKNSVEAKFN